MKMYWQEKKRGLDLLVEMNDGETYSVGGVRVTRRGIEALAKTNGYDPGRAVKGLDSVEEGRAFVEQFEPWRDFFPFEELELEPEVRPMAAS